MDFGILTRTFTPEELAQELPLDEEAHDQTQRDMPPTYTEFLALNRDSTYSDLRQHLQGMIGDLFPGKTVLELGPGSKDIFYKLMEGGDARNWTSFDISPAVVKGLKNVQEQYESYSGVQGSFRALPFEDNSLDVICGLSCLDSIIGFESVGSELYRVLKPRGVLVHVQDLLPSDMTLLSLLAREEPGSSFSTHCIDQGDGSSRGISLISSPEYGLIDAHHYLHEGLEKEFGEIGFTTERKEQLAYSEEMGDECCIARYLMGEGTEQECSYSLLVMRKG